METFVEGLTKLVKDTFPELNGRAMSVSDVEPFDRSNVPTLPLAIVGLVSEPASQPPTGGQITLSPEVIVQFVHEPVRYKKGSEDSPFWAFYDYEPLRNQMLAVAKKWQVPNGGPLQYLGLEIEAEKWAVFITFRFRASITWCAPEEPSAPPVAIIGRVLQPSVADLCCDCEQAEEKDGCQPARNRNPYGKE